MIFKVTPKSNLSMILRLYYLIQLTNEPCVNFYTQLLKKKIHKSPVFKKLVNYNDYITLKYKEHSFFEICFLVSSYAIYLSVPFRHQYLIFLMPEGIHT